MRTMPCETLVIISMRRRRSIYVTMMNIKKSLETDRKAQRILDRLLPQEAIEEIVTDSLHSLKSTPLQEILEIFDNSYWLSLIEGYLRKIGDPTAPKLPESENKDEDFVLCDKFLFFPPDCQDEFKRWKPLYDELCGVIERNAGDKVALLAYFADLIQPIKKYSQYFHPDKNDQNSSKMSKVLLRIATCDLNLEFKKSGVYIQIHCTKYKTVRMRKHLQKRSSTMHCTVLCMKD